MFVQKRKQDKEKHSLSLSLSTRRPPPPHTHTHTHTHTLLYPFFLALFCNFYSQLKNILTIPQEGRAE